MYKVTLFGKVTEIYCTKRIYLLEKADGICSV